jgi:ribosomal RNA-processing protein 8
MKLTSHIPARRSIPVAFSRLQQKLLEVGSHLDHRMFSVEGWNLGELVPQSTPKKNQKRKRDGKEGQTSTNPKSSRLPRTNPFSMRKDADSNLLSKPIDRQVGDESSQTTRRKETRPRKKAKKKPESKIEERDSEKTPEPLPSSSSTPPQESVKLTALQKKMKERLSGSQFRQLNEKLYTTKSSEAFTLFKDQPALFNDVSLPPQFF